MVLYPVDPQTLIPDPELWTSGPESHTDESTSFSADWDCINLPRVDIPHSRNEEERPDVLVIPKVRDARWIRLLFILFVQTGKKARVQHLSHEITKRHRWRGCDAWRWWPFYHSNQFWRNNESARCFIVHVEDEKRPTDWRGFVDIWQDGIFFFFLSSTKVRVGDIVLIMCHWVEESPKHPHTDTPTYVRSDVKSTTVLFTLSPALTSLQTFVCSESHLLLFLFFSIFLPP
jgi:hypothetical protein